MRRKDFNGAHECNGAESLIRSRILKSWVGWNMAGSCRLVMRRVLDGGDGLIRGGIEERSRERGVRVPLDTGLEECEAGGEVPSFVIVVAAEVYVSRKADCGSCCL